MTKKATIIISPRDGHTGLEDCISEIYDQTDQSLFDLAILDLSYPRRIIESTKR